MARPRSSALRSFTVLLAVAAVLFLARSLWLPALGRALVTDQGPAKADVIVVLGGDYQGSRILKAADLVRAGYAPLVLVSGPSGFFGVHESDFAISFAVRAGNPAEWFVSFPHSARSTAEESRVLLPELKRRNARRYLLVTSTYHTARAARIFRAAGDAMDGGIQMRVVAAPDPYFTPDSWWRTREGRKTFFLEWCKTVAGAAGI